MTNIKLEILKNLDEILSRFLAVEQAFKPTSYQYPHQDNPQIPAYKVDTETKALKVM